MASSTKTVEERSRGQSRGIDRHAPAGVVAARAARRWRRSAPPREPRRRSATPKRSNPTTVPSGEMRLLRRVTVGVTTEDVAWMHSLGYYGYLEWQLNPESMGDPECEARLQPLITINLAPLSLYACRIRRSSSVSSTEATIIRAIYSNRQLFERMVEFWTDHFNTNITSVGILKTLEVRDVYRRNALGTFAGMLNASASSPAMLTYLNNTQSDGRPGRVPNQNYARELMELHTLGVDGGYTQQDVVEVARCFTGWRTFFNTGDLARRNVFLRPEPPRQQQQARPRRADCGRRRLQRRPERPATSSAEHPSCARFVSTEAPALAAQLRAVAGAGRGHRRRVHAHAAETSSRSCGGSCTTTTCSGRRRSSSVRSTSSSRRCGS